MSNTWGFRPNPKKLFSPASIAGLDLWLDATIGVTQAAGKASAWADQSGLGHNLAQATGSKQPVYSATGNGVNGPYLQGVIANSVSMSGTWTIAQPAHLFIVSNWLPTAATFHDFCDGGGPNTQRIFADTSATPSLHTNGGVDQGGFVAPTLGSWQIYEALYSGAASYLNVAQTSVVPVGNAGNVSPGGITLFSFGDGVSNPCDAKIVSVVRYSVTLASADRTALISYLQTTWAAT